MIILRKIQIVKKSKKQHKAAVAAITMFSKKVWALQTVKDCLKNLESKVNKIFANRNTLKENQIKGEKQLTDLTETVNFFFRKVS